MFHDLRRAATTGMARLDMRRTSLTGVLNHDAGKFAALPPSTTVSSMWPSAKAALETWGRYIETSSRPIRRMWCLAAAG